MVRYEASSPRSSAACWDRVGVLFAFLVTQALDDLGLGFAVPLGQLVAIIVLAALVGVVGAIAPARRQLAARRARRSSHPE